MLKISSLTTYGTSRIKIDGADRDIASFSAQIDGNSGNYSVSKNVSDREAYASHKEEVNNDFDAFELYVAEALKQGE